MLGGHKPLVWFGRLFDILERPRRIVRIPSLAILADVLGWLTRRPEITGAMVLRMGVDLVANNSKARADFGYVSRKFLAGGLSDIRPQSDNTKQMK